MAIAIEGSKGNRIVEVSDEGRMHVAAVTETDMEHRNEEGFVWSLPFDAVDPTSDNDIFVYIQNTEPSLNMHIRRIVLSSTVVGFVEVLRVTGTAVGGAAATLVNFNQGFSSKTPTGIFETGSDITALVDGGKYVFQQLAVANTTYTITLHHDIILDKNGAMALNWVPSTGILSGVVYFFLHK